MIKAYSFSQNTLYLTIAYIFEKIFVFFYFIFLARYLGTVGFGIYSFAISFIAIFLVFVDLGFSTVLIREIAKNKEKAKEYLENVLTFKIITSLIISLFVVFFVNLLNYPISTRYFIYLLIPFIIFESLSSTFFAFFRGFQNLYYESISFIGGKSIYILLGFIFIFLKLPLIYFALPIVVGSLFSFLYSFFKAKKYLNFGLSLNKQIISFFFKIALPIVFGVIFSVIFSNINTVIISSLVGDHFAGVFSAAFRIPMALLFLPTAVGASIFPVFSYLVKENNKEKLENAFEKVLFYIILLSFPIVFGGLVLGEKIISFLYGPKFLEAIVSFKILIFITPFLFLDFIFSSLLTAFDKQKENAISRGIGLAINIFLSFILIPQLTHLGGAIAFAVGFVVFSLIQILMVSKLIPFQFKKIFKKLILIIISCLIMTFLLYFLREKIHFFFSLLIGIVAYFLSLYLLGGIKNENLKELKLMVTVTLRRGDKDKIE